jgi:hypothetical protein
MSLSISRIDDDIIDRLYAELSVLYQEKESSPADRRLDDRIRESLQRLRVAQADEVVRLRRSFESGLKMPLGAGAELLNRVRQMRSSHEDSTSGNSASAPADDPET